MPDIVEDAPFNGEERNSHSRSASPGQGETPSPERRHRAREMHRSYYRWLRLSRVAQVAFFVMAALFLLWVVPWLPSGLEIDDYTPELGFTAYLLGVVVVTAVLALSFQELTRRQRERLMVWAAVYDEATGLHSRAYLYDRLFLECERAQRSGGAFSVLVLQMRIGSTAPGPPPTLSNRALQELAELINRLTHPTDLVALLSGSELAILAMGVDREDRGPLLERLRAAIESELPRLLDRPALVHVIRGAVTYGIEAKEPGALVQAARTAAALALPPRAQAA